MKRVFRRRAATGRLGLFAIAVLLVILAAALLPALASAATLTVPGSAATINGAIALAAPGDTVQVAPGTYSENVVVNKSITLQGSPLTPSATVISAFFADANALEVTANNVHVTGFTVTDSIVCEIYLDHVNGAVIDQVNMVDGTNYFFNYGIFADGGAANTVSRSSINVSGNPGIVASSNNLSTILNNTVSGAGEFGVWVFDSTDTAVSGNAVSGPGLAAATGVLVQESGGTVVSGNTVSGCSIGLWLWNVTSTAVSDNTISLNSDYGVLAYGAGGEAHVNDNTIAGNSVGVASQDELLLDATSNWWGDSSGPFDDKSLPNVPDYNNPGGLGNSVGPYVDYDPWATNGLTLSVAVVGNGTVAKDPDAPAYELGTTVQLTPTPAAGWHFAGWSGDATGSASPLSILMDGNKAVTATFMQDGVFSSIAVTAPTGTTSHAQGSALPVTWTTNQAVATGEFSIWVVSSANGWYGGKIVAADGTASYANSVNLDVPVDTGYRVFVYYRATPGDPWGIYGFSSGTVDVTATFNSIAVTAPTGTTSQAQGSALPVTWTTNQAVATGQFSIWVVSPANGWYVGKIVAADGTANYANSVNLGVPVDTGYRVFVYYRATPGDPWGIYGTSPGTVDVTAGFSSIAVTAPTGTTSQAQGSALPVTWTTNQAVATGQFSIWVVSPANGWYVGKIHAADGTASYSDSVNLDVPVDTGYRVFVYYRATPGDPWDIYGTSTGTVDVTAAATFNSIAVTAPTGTTSQVQGSALPVTWTTNQAVATGEFSIWVVSTANGWYVGQIVAADGTASYANSVNLGVPVDTGYRVFVYYRATPGDPWGIYGMSPGTVDVTL